jgi:hypothetical protein
VIVHRLSVLALITAIVYGKSCYLLFLFGVGSLFDAMPLDFANILEQEVLCWILTVLTAMFTLTAAVIFCMTWHPTHQVILMGLVTLFVMECFFPVTVTASTALWLFNRICLMEALIVSGSMFLVARVNSRCIRSVLYPSLGLG